MQFSYPIWVLLGYIYSMLCIAFFYLLVSIYLPLIIYPCPCHLLVNELFNLLRCLAMLRVSCHLIGKYGQESSHLSGYPWSHLFDLSHVIWKSSFEVRAEWQGLENEVTGIVRLDRLRTVRGWRWFWATYCATTYPIIVSMSLLPSLTWLLMHGPRYVVKVDLGDSPRKLAVMFKGWGLLRMVDVSTPLSNLVGWVSRIVLASCG